MLRKRGESKIKLIDFGLSRRILPGTVVKDMIGTPEFVGKFISVSLSIFQYFQPSFIVFWNY